MGDTQPPEKVDETGKPTPTDQQPPADSGKDKQPDNGADDAKPGETKDKPDDQDKKPDAPAKPDVDDGEEPPVVKKTPADFIKERRIRKAAKDAAKENEAADDDDDETPDAGDDDDIDPDDEARISKVIDKKIGSRLQVLDQQAEKATLDEYFNSEDAKELNITPAEKSKIERWWKHSSRNHLPVSSVAYEVLGKRLLKKGAEMERQAADNERRDKPTGHEGKGGGAKKPVSELTSAEMEQQILEVKKRAADR